MAKTTKRSKPYINLVETADWLLKRCKEDQVDGHLSISADVLKDYLLNIKEYGKELEEKKALASAALVRVLEDMEGN